jgi:hypothetical protein
MKKYEARIAMRLIIRAAFLCAVLHISGTSPALADDGTSTTCKIADAQKHAMIQITQTASGGVSAPAVCVTHDGDVTWKPDKDTWTWFTLFVDDDHSPFDKGKILHGKGNDNDHIKNNPCAGASTCSFTYYGLVIIKNVPYLIDPKIIVNANAIDDAKKRQGKSKKK